MNETTKLVSKALNNSDPIDPHHHGNIWTSFLGVMSTMAGAGILALPRTLEIIGPIPGLIMLFFIAVITWASVHYLCVCADATGEYTFEGLSSRLFGWKGVWIIRVFTVLLLFGAVVMFMVIAMDLLTPLVGAYLDRAMIGIAYTIFVIPFCLPDTIYALRYTNFLVIICLIFILNALFRRTVEYGIWPVNSHASDRSIWGILSMISSTIPIQSLSFGVQINAIRAYGELTKKSDMKIVNLMLCIMGFIFYSMFALFGYICFNGSPPDDILNGFSRNDYLINCGRAALAFCMIFKTPITFQPFREILEMVCLGHDKRIMSFRVATTIIFMALACMLAIYAGTLSNVMRIMGGTAGLWIAFSTPGFFLLEVARGYVDGRNMTKYRLPALILISFGILASLFSIQEYFSHSLIFAKNPTLK